jgi:hypothetical protein
MIVAAFSGSELLSKLFGEGFTEAETFLWGGEFLFSKCEGTGIIRVEVYIKGVFV